MRSVNVCDTGRSFYMVSSTYADEKTDNRRTKIGKKKIRNPHVYLSYIPYVWFTNGLVHYRLFNLKRHHWYSLSSMFIDRIVTGKYYNYYSLYKKIPFLWSTFCSSESGERKKKNRSFFVQVYLIIIIIWINSFRDIIVNPQLSVVCMNNETGNVDGVMINEGK